MSDDDDEQTGDPEFLTTREAAALLRLKPNTLEKMRVYGGGPVFRKHGRNVLYRRADLDAWSDLRKQDMTGEG